MPATDLVRSVRRGEQTSWQFAHVRAVSKGGPRHDPAYSLDEIDEPENLFWCCTDCHQVVDLTELWSLDRLLEVLNTNRARTHAGDVTIEGEIEVSGQFSENVTGVDAGGRSATLKPGTRIRVHGIGSRNVTGVNT
jgi:hypothetical protein